MPASHTATQRPSVIQLAIKERAALYAAYIPAFSTGGLFIPTTRDYKIGDAWRQLEPGMVLTIEPGLYIPPGTRGIPPEFRNIGIRIEDDVLVTREGHEVLTHGVPKQARDIEQLMAGRE